jgi:hypothetical protein
MIGRFKVFIFSLCEVFTSSFPIFRFVPSSSWSMHNGVDASWLVATHLEALHLEGLTCGLKVKASFGPKEERGGNV